MRLGDLLSKAPDNEEKQIEGFLVGQSVRPGQHKLIESGHIIRTIRCRTCDDDRNFMSGKKVSCLVVGDRVVSIDAFLKCVACDATIETWYLLVSRDGLHEQSPTVRLERYVENRRDMAGRVGLGVGEFDDLLERAQLAFEAKLGAGAMVYLRKIFEAITVQVADVAGISTTTTNGKRKPFRTLLQEVDATRHIIPTAFSSDGYLLFSELSEIVHGDSSEELALQKYDPCRKLVIGIIQNVASDQEMKRAIKDLGWNMSSLDLPSNEEVTS
ncbi:hypothetical protein [Amycolatopsis anabasis]|uniref:hypothetical protein n=1 Tax=Amycolatopsis anabasis TaxID=1840409 RepID=UPI00131D36A3|nr:hypothetical protein [Amycolatopsis anabasis]